MPLLRVKNIDLGQNPLDIRNVKGRREEARRFWLI
jgi:hypothetical protein